ncbi:ArsR family transcriptional regulator [Alicyclobacillus fastidiosus]|uniref:ArsR family transcriptional regulator n=1 Tax=Alicyclobacillus fastidiosus TaxID=392011 RepID=A0ABV5AEJ8_9BACL|nr:ArsR family transcriptional regulator [Alicyclobacillus fastidiosus]WEH09561.1 ArsR family transcriptional regulator [Alicyclobacillus fastidiosus]
MSIRLGVLGADDSVAVIQTVVNEYADIEMIPVVYEEEYEIIDKIAPYVKQTDMWLCSGQVPYAIVKEHLNCPVFYTRHSGEGLYKALLYLVHEQGIKISEMSFDTLSETTLETFLQDAGIQTTYHLKHYRGGISSHELAMYHADLWNKNVTKVAVTCLRSAQLQLAQQGIPTIHITPAASEVRQVLNNIVQTHELILSREGQIVVQVIQLCSEASHGNVAEFHALINRYTRALHGTAQQIEPGKWRIYATRKEIENITDGLTSTPRMEGDLSLGLSGGIGIAQTIREGEERAGFALQQALLYGAGNWMCASDDHVLYGPLGKPQEALSYTYVRDDLEALGQAVSLSALTLTKLAAVLEKRGSNRITAHELAEYLQMLPRSARRILLLLEEHGLAEVVGEQTPYLRGRPRKIYEIDLARNVG